MSLSHKWLSCKSSAHYFCILHGVYGSTQGKGDFAATIIPHLCHVWYHYREYASALQVQIRALLNDTVGTLACGRYSSPDVTMGIILGTGTNCCYVEQVANIKKLKDSSKGKPEDSMVINMEWGSYISELLPMTADDYASDANGANPGKCFFEKLISGMFMGESVRRLELIAVIQAFSKISVQSIQSHKLFLLIPWSTLSSLLSLSLKPVSTFIYALLTDKA